MRKILTALEKTAVFSNWQDKHSNGFLSHFFCPVDSQLKVKANWDLGFYDPDKDKITIFTHHGDENFSIKPEDDVFKKDTQVEKLDIDIVKISFDDAVAKVQENVSTLFPG